MWDRKAPWKDGQPLTYNQGRPSEIEWRDADTPFHLLVTFDGFDRGRSSATATFKDANGIIYSMFLTDFSDVIMQQGVEQGGEIAGFFVIRKCGANYGIRMLFGSIDRQMGAPNCD